MLFQSVVTWSFQRDPGPANFHRIIATFLVIQVRRATYPDLDPDLSASCRRRMAITAGFVDISNAVFPLYKEYVTVSLSSFPQTQATATDHSIEQCKTYSTLRTEAVRASRSSITEGSEAIIRAVLPLYIIHTRPDPSPTQLSAMIRSSHPVFQIHTRMVVK